MSGRLRSITVRTQFEGYHQYPGAGLIDPRIKFLEYPHRHMFYVTVSMSVAHEDREIEFFLAKWALDEYIQAALTKDSNRSCEAMADAIIDEHLIPKYSDERGKLRRVVVTVSEDGESDGTVETFI